MAKKTTAPKAFCFVLMPFGDDFRDVYLLGIKEACAQAGAYCERVDEQIFHESILDRIYNQIHKADLIVADMTGRNPNVFYEVGYAHALGKRTVLLTRQADDIPFDLKHFPHIVYGASIATLKEELTARVKWSIENPPENGTIQTIGIELYLKGKPLSAGGAAFICETGKVAAPTIDIHNASSRTYESGAFKLGLITDGNLRKCRGSGVTMASLPNGKRLHMFPNFDTLFPDESTSYNVIMDEAPSQGQTFDVTLRVFTDAGTRDFGLTIFPKT